MSTLPIRVIAGPTSASTPHTPTPTPTPHIVAGHLKLEQPEGVGAEEEVVAEHPEPEGAGEVVARHLELERVGDIVTLRGCITRSWRGCVGIITTRSLREGVGVHLHPQEEVGGHLQVLGRLFPI